MTLLSVPVRLSLFVALAATVAAVSGGTRVPRECSVSLDVLEHTWGGTGHWKRLAPYPVARDASPTDSIGVWLERSMDAGGHAQLRRVSLTETRVATFEASSCAPSIVVHRRTFDAAELRASFTDDSLRALVRSNARGIIYVWSPRMPLSEQGLRGAELAARRVGARFTAVEANEIGALELVYRNATIHFPTASFYADGRVIGTAIPGYKDEETYVALANDAFANPNAEPVASTSAPAFWVDHNAKIETHNTVETVRRVGFFFKPAGASGWLSYTANNAAYLFDLATRHEVRIPGTVDPVPSPDGRLLTRPGLRWYDIKGLIGGDTTVLAIDPELPDEYQTLSVFHSSPETVRYRVVTGWRTHIKYRDYDVQFTKTGALKSAVPAGGATVPCPDRTFTLPISAKGSPEFGAFDVATQSNHIMEVAADGVSCTEKLDFGFATGKQAFSYDGASVAFATSRINADADGPLVRPKELFYRDALVLFRKTNRIVPLSVNQPIQAMSFPEFLPDGKSIVLDQAARQRTTEVFRIVSIK